MTKHPPKFTRLLVAMALYMLLVPFLPVGGTANTVLAFVFLIVLAVAVFDLGLKPRKIVLVVALLLTPAIIAGLVSVVFDTSVPARVIAEAAVLVFILFAIARFFREMMRHDSVTSETIRGAICVYVFIGFAFASAFTLLDMAEPGSFSLPEYRAADSESSGHIETIATGKDTSGRRRLTYFSFVTLTTLGYGDITPATARAGNLAILEAIIGQLFIATIIARLVAGRVPASPQKNPTSEKGDPED